MEGGGEERGREKESMDRGGWRMVELAPGGEEDGREGEGKEMVVATSNVYENFLHRLHRGHE